MTKSIEIKRLRFECKKTYFKISVISKAGADVVRTIPILLLSLIHSELQYNYNSTVLLLVHCCKHPMIYIVIK